ncbi:MAG: TPR end-of-group domain-containing protein [Mucilaginibacter sp.]
MTLRKFILVLSLLFVFCLTNNAFGQATAHTSIEKDTVARKKQIESMINLLTKALSNHIQSKNELAIAHFTRGTSYMQLKKYENAIKDFNSVISLDIKLESLPGNIYWERAICYEMIKKYQLAIDDYQKALLLTNNDSFKRAALYNNIAINQTRLKLFNLALSSDSTAIAIEPKYTLSNVNRGGVYLNTKKYQLAIEDFTVALNGNYSKEQFSRILTFRADAKRLLKLYRDAINDYALAVKLNPNNGWAYWGRASTYSRNGDFELADADYTKAMSFFTGNNSNLATLYDDRAAMEMGEEKYQKALQDDSIALKYNDKYAPAYYNRATAYAQNGDVQLSIDAYNQAIPFYKDNNRALSGIQDAIANGEYFLGEYDQAIKSSTMAISFNDKMWASYLNRGRAYLKKNNKDLALADFNKILKEDTAKLTYEYAFALFCTGQQEAAIQQLQKAAISTTNPAVLRSHYYNLACLYSLMNKPDEANTYLRKCIEDGYPKKYPQIDPDLENIRSTPEFKNIIGLK